MYKTPQIISAMILAAALTGCGGGDGPAPLSLNVPTTNPAPNGTVVGSATKGTIKNAVVTMSQQNSSGTFVPIGTGTTSASGEYSVAYTGYSGGNVLVCVRGKAPTDTPPLTTMVCDATDGDACGATGATDGSAPGDINDNNIYDLGEELLLDESFELCTCLPGPPVAGIRAPITPFTELVRRRAEERDANAALAEDALTALLRAASEVNQLLGGIDVLRQEPIDLSSPEARDAASPTELVYSALLAAVIGRQTGAGGELILETAISSLVADFAGGAFGIGDFRELIAEAQEQLLATGLDDRSGVLATLDEQANECEARNADGDPNNDCASFDPEPTPETNLGPISRAKNLIANVRDTLNGLNDLETPRLAFGEQAEIAGNLLSPPDYDNGDGTTTKVVGPVDDLFQGIVKAVGAGAFCVEDNTAQDADGDFTTTSAATCGSGYVVKKTYPPDRDLEIADHQAAFMDFPATISVNGSQVTVTIDGADEDVDANLTVIGTNNAAFTIVNPLSAGISGVAENVGTGTGLRLTIATGAFSLTKTGAVALDDNNNATDGDSKRILSANFTLPDITLAQIREGTQAGGPVSFTGALGATVVRCTKQSCVDRENLPPSADPDDGEATFFPSALNLSGSFSNAENSTEMSVEVGVSNAASFDPGFANEGSNGEDDITPTNFPLASATLRFDAVFTDAPATRVVVTGNLLGMFSQPDDADSDSLAENDLNATASLTLLRDLPEPEGTPVNPALEQVFRVQGNSVDDGSTTGGVATITDSNNAALNVRFQDDGVNPEDGAGQDGNVDGTLRVDGVQVGILRKLSSGLVIISYADGTFETLF